MVKWTFPALIKFTCTDLKLPDHYLTFYVPAVLRPYAATIESKKYYYVTVTKAHKSRSTGPKGQSNHFHGHVRQIAEYTGHELEEIKLEVKRRAMKRGFPSLTDELGNIVYSKFDNRALPISESDASVEESGYLIEEAHALADGLDIRLIEE